jgi:antitoxin component of RelBE/YafQ-DinJ toxin-antitoxin module
MIHHKTEVFTFRLDAALKQSFTDLAEQQHLPPAELMRQLVQDYVRHEADKLFHYEAERQSRSIAQRAQKYPHSDENMVLQELGDDYFGDEWKA